MAGRILVPQPGIKPVPPTVKVWSLNHWTTGNSQVYEILKWQYMQIFTYKDIHPSVIYQQGCSSRCAL